MNIQFNHLKNIKSFLQVLFPDFKGNRFQLNEKNSDKLTRYLVSILDSLIKAENYYHKRNFVPGEESFFVNQNPVVMLKNISSYLNKFNTRLFGFTKTERQTFIFIIDNIADFYKSRDLFEQEKDKSDGYTDYKFWIENFLKIFEQKIKGVLRKERVFSEHHGQEGGASKEKTGKNEIVFSNSEMKLSLSPFIIPKKDSCLFLHEIQDDKLSYRNLTTGKSVGVKDRKLDIEVFEFLLSNFNFRNARKIKSRLRVYDNLLFKQSELIENVYLYSQKRNFVVSYNLLKSVSLEELKLPLLFLVQMRNLLELNRIFDLKRMLQKFILLFPYYPDGYKILGDIYFKEENYELAHNAYIKVLNLTQNKKVAEKVRSIKEEIEKNRRKVESSRNELFYDITEEIFQNHDQIISREKEFRQMVEVLMSRSRRNVLLVGESGVGKTAMIRLLAQKILDGDVPDFLKDKKIKEINFVALLTGSKYRGQFEEKALKMLEEFKQQDAILVLEDIHLMISSGASRGTSMDLVNILKQFLREKSIQVIATSTYEEFKNTIEKDNSLLGFFQKIVINELSVSHTRMILGNMAKSVLENGNIIVTEKMIGDVTESAKRNIREKKLPDSAIMLLDRAISKLKLKNSLDEEQRQEINGSDILEVLSDMLNLPESNISVTLKSRLAGLREAVGMSIVGQDEALEKIVSSVITSKLNMDIKNNRPDGVFLFIGPTGVGKTETAIALAKALYGSEDYLIRIDMSEYMEKFTYSRFIGAAPGYVGYYDTNQLTDKVRQNPFSVILLDEFEKADLQLLNIFLQVFDAGRLTDARGNVVDFSHSTVIMTSNIGTSLFSQSQMGYQSDLSTGNVSRSALIKSLKKFFSPEFLNRIDEIVVFDHLRESDIKKIIGQQLSGVRKNMEKQGKEMVIRESVFDFIIKRYHSREYGARNISRALKGEILEKLAALALKSEWDDAQVVICDVNRNAIEISLGDETHAALNKAQLLEDSDEK